MLSHDLKRLVREKANTVKLLLLREINRRKCTEDKEGDKTPSFFMAFYYTEGSFGPI